MVQEVLAALRIKPNGLYVDCTLGEGGHSLAILEQVSAARVLGLDLDDQAIGSAEQRLEAHREQAVLVQRNFAEVDTIADERGFRPADGVLFDLGLSSLQLESGQRGFSFRREARLDMRFDPNQKVTAHEVVNEYSEITLADIIRRLGEEPRASRVASAIIRSRPIETTTRLADVVARALGHSFKSRIHPATRTFQAIRITVNEELDNLRLGLERAVQILSIGGRVAVISYHSLEDRLAKNTLRREASNCVCPPRTPECVCGHTASLKLINRKVIRPTPDEVRVNPRSRSARMRVAERI